MTAETRPPSFQPKKRTVLIAGVVLALVFVALFLSGYLPLAQRQSALKAESGRASDAAIRVTVAHPKRVSGDERVQLPGTIQAIEETTIYPRVNGYLKKWYVDIGDEVKAGDLLAEIETPELSEEKHQAEAAVGQARARLLTAEANVRLTTSSYERYKGASERGGISPQELAERSAAVETAQAAVAAAKADIAAGEANVRRLAQFLSFDKVRAPFSGTITQRTAEVGGLLNAGNGTSQALFRLARVDPVRVFVSVPQSYAPAVRAGAVAEIRIREIAQPFEGKITRSAGALDPSSRTLLTQIEVPNPTHTLLPGMYAQARLVLPQGSYDLRVPASALIVGAQGTQVATVDPSARIHLKKVEITGDYGTELAVNGVAEDDRIVVDPGTNLSEGAKVEVNEPKKGGVPGATSGGERSAP